MSAAVLSTPSELLPGVTARGLGADYTDALTAPLVELDERLGEVVTQVLDLYEAAGSLLDLLGDWSGEPRGGLTDAEYRRIIAGRRVVLEATVTPPAVWRAWTGLTDALTATIDESVAGVILTAFVDFVPTILWVVRVAVVVRDLIGAGIEPYGLLAPPSTFLWDVHAFDDAGFAFDFGSPA